MKRIQYTGCNDDEVMRFCGDKMMAPYFCMGFTLLSVMTDEGVVSVNEGDYIVRLDDGRIRVE